MATATISMKIWGVVILSVQGVYGVEPISSCKKFIDLMRAPGIKITASAQRPVLLPREGLEPVISVKNDSAKVLEVPQIDVNSGLFVFEGHVDFSEEHRNAKEREFCSFPTVDLQPGEERRFPLYYPGPAWSESMNGEDVHAFAASARLGRQSFEIHMGAIKLTGVYEVHAVQNAKAYCVDKTWRISKVQRDLASDPLKRNESTCILISLLEQDNKWYLFAGQDVELASRFQEEVESIRRANRQLTASEQILEPLPYGGFVIASFDSEPNLRAVRLPAITKQEDFVVMDKNARLTFKSLSETYESKRRPTLGRP